MFSFLARRISFRAMSTAPLFKPFNIALIQLGQVTADKAANLRHARDMILKAARAEGAGDSLKPSYTGAEKVDVVVLPVCLRILPHRSLLDSMIGAGMFQFALRTCTFPGVR